MLPYRRAPHEAGERESLKAFLDENRAILLWKLEGLSLEAASRSMVPSGTSMLGLIKHMAWVERWWFVDFVGGEKLEYPWNREDPDADWRIGDDETIESVSRFYADSVAQADAIIDAAESLDVRVESGRHVRSLRWVMIHMIEETARHAGHADIIRELIDGTVGYTPDD